MRLPRAVGLIVFLQTGSYLIPELSRNDRFVQAGVNLFSMDNLTDVNAIIQQMIERSPGVRRTSRGSPNGTGSDLAVDPFAIQEFFELADTAEPQIFSENLPYGSCFYRIHDEPTVNAIVALRDGAAHPHALLFRGGNLVPNPLASDFALELGERQQDV
jgi:hypothetical protein